jgi:hypothetical protein
LLHPRQSIRFMSLFLPSVSGVVGQSPRDGPSPRDRLLVVVPSPRLPLPFERGRRRSRGRAAVARRRSRGQGIFRRRAAIARGTAIVGTGRPS